MAKRGISLQSGGGNDDDNNEEEKLLKPNEMNSTLEWDMNILFWITHPSRQLGALSKRDLNKIEWWEIKYF